MKYVQVNEMTGSCVGDSLSPLVVFTAIDGLSP